MTIKIAKKEFEEGVIVLEKTLTPLKIGAVLYIYRGGQRLGESLARALRVPSYPLDMSYPLSRPLRKLPSWFSILIWPIKELSYKLLGPKPNDKQFKIPHESPILLVDDTASSGQTLTEAISLLESLGASRDKIVTVVWRQGAKAAHVVDHFVTTKKFNRWWAPQSKTNSPHP